MTMAFINISMVETFLIRETDAFVGEVK